MRTNHVRGRQFLPCLLRGPSWSTKAHDVGIRRLRYLHDDGRYPSQLQGYWQRTCHFVGLGYVLFPLHAYFWRQR